MAPSVETTPRSRSGSPEIRTNPNSPTRYAPQRTRSTASIQKHTKRFQIFQKLPLEVQDLVWREALGLDSPTVHGVTVRRSTIGDTGVHMVADLLWNSNTGARRTPIYPARDALSLVCRRSKVAGEREPRTWEATEPYLLHSDRFWVPTQQVDLWRDLFVLSNQLQGDIKQADKIPKAQYIGVTWEGMWDLHVVEKLEKVVELFPDVNTIYVVVPAASTIHPHLEEWPDEALPVLNAYERGCRARVIDETNREFSCDDMVYKEIPIEALSSMAGLQQPLSYINDFNANLDVRCQETEEDGGVFRRPAIRAMSWEMAHRVRARFP